MSHSALPAIVTGASGFVGRRVLARAGRGAVALSLGATDWRERVERASLGGACVYHLAARVHDQGATEADFERDNVEKTVAIAEAAARAGAHRLVFLSSIKVNGEETLDRPFRPSDPPAPRDAYARSKHRAEEALRELSGRTGLGVTIIRSPLVVGPGAGGNLRALLRLAATPLPLPFGSLRNRRTLIGVDDLAALLLACGNAPAVAGRTFLAGHPDAVSTPRLLHAIRSAWGRSDRLFPMSAAALEALAAPVLGREKMQRLTRSLEVDVSETLRALAWMPSESVGHAASRMAIAYRDGAAS